MKSGHLTNKGLLATIFLYGAGAMLWNLDYNFVYHDEALNIFMGREVILGLPCASCAQNTGSVLIQPVLAAMGDAYGGILGARAVGIPFALGLAWMIYGTGRTLFSEKLGALSALLFLLFGTVIYLSKLATYDIIAGFFLGLSMYCMFRSEKKSSSALLLIGAISLFLAAMTKYVVAVYILPFVIYVFWRHGILRAAAFFLFPLLILLFVYVYLALYPVREVIMGSSGSVYEQSRASFNDLLNWTFRWLGMPYLLAFFGMFHKRHGKTAIVLIILSTPIILLHLLSGVEQSVNKNVIFAIILLAPACALGVSHMGNLFTTGVSKSWAKYLFMSAVLVVIWVYGINDLKWLERQYPDLNPAVEYFLGNGFSGMTAVVDSDFGDAVYMFTITPKIHDAQFYAIRDVLNRMENGFLPDFVILDGYYGKKTLREIAKSYLPDNYEFARSFQLKMSWGTRDVQIYKRKVFL